MEVVLQRSHLLNYKAELVNTNVHTQHMAGW